MLVEMELMRGPIFLIRCPVRLSHASLIANTNCLAPIHLDRHSRHQPPESVCVRVGPVALRRWSCVANACE